MAQVNSYQKILMRQTFERLCAVSWFAWSGIEPIRLIVAMRKGLLVGHLLLITFWPIDFQPQQMHVCAFQIYKAAIPRTVEYKVSAYERYDAHALCCNTSLVHSS